MKAKRRATAALLLVVAMVASLFTFSAPAYATSDYDSLLQTVSTLTVDTSGGAGTSSMDISNTWWTDYQQSYALRMLQGLGWPTDFVTTFQNDVNEGGSYGVYYYDTAYGPFIYIIASDDPDATCSFTGPATTGSFDCVVHAGYGYVQSGYFTHNSYGGNGCGNPWGGFHCSSDGMDIYQSPTEHGPSSSSYTPISMPNTDLSGVKFFIWNFNTTYPSGYAGEYLPTMPRNESTGATYVAMGDSYSSGEGNSPFETFSDIDGIDECHRSSNAYPLTLDASLSLGGMAFVACSGATTDALGNGGSGTGAWQESPQINALGSSTNVVTLTIGGNDLGFADVMPYCIESFATWTGDGYGCSSDTDVTDGVADRLMGLAGTAAVTQYTLGAPSREIHALKDVLMAIATDAPNAHIYIAGYPHLFGSSLEDYASSEVAPGGGTCDVGYWGTTLDVSYTDAQWINSEVDALNSVIQDAVNYEQSEDVDVTYVVPSTFDSHGLCDSSTAWINGVELTGSLGSPTPLPGSFHPTGDGISDGYEAAFENALTN